MKKRYHLQCTSLLKKAIRYFLMVPAMLVCTKITVAQMPAVPVPDHVVIIVMENHSTTEIIGSTTAPYINQLATAGALFTQSFGLTHPSQPNYLMLFSGSQQGVTNDLTSTAAPFSTPNLGAALLAKGLTFSIYSEGLPSVGYTGDISGAYVRKHNPAVNWQGAASNSIPSNLNQPFKNFPTTNYALLPKVSFVIPNLLDDMHDGSVNTGDLWLKNNMDGYAQWAKANNSLLIITFDEDDYTLNNQISTVFYGAPVKPGKYSEHIDHYKVLRTIEDMFGLSYCGASAVSTPLTDCWNTSQKSAFTFVDFDAVNLNFTGFGGAAFTKVSNPFKTGLDTSNFIGQCIKANASQTWAGISSDQLNSKIDFSTNTVFKVKVYAPKICTILLKLEDYNNGSISKEVKINNTKINQWEDLSFDFTGAPSVTYDKMSLFFDFGSATANTYYFDDIHLTSNKVITGLKSKQNITSGIRLFPNPVLQELYVENDQPFVEISIVNLEGKEIEHIFNTEQITKINTSSLASGIYVVKMLSGGTLHCKRFIKE